MIPMVVASIVEIIAARFPLVSHAMMTIGAMTIPMALKIIVMFTMFGYINARARDSSPITRMDILVYFIFPLGSLFFIPRKSLVKFTERTKRTVSAVERMAAKNATATSPIIIGGTSLVKL